MEQINTLDENNLPKSIKRVADEFGIAYTTLKNRYAKFLSGKNVNKRGGNNRLFTEDEEKDLADCIKNVYVALNLYFDDDSLKELATLRWNYLHANKNGSIDKASVSDGWVFNFKQKWSLSTQRCKYIRIATKNTDEETTLFLDTCHNIFMEVPREFIFNMDETFWRLDANKYVIGIRGSEHRKVINNFPKEGMTTIFIISAAGVFLPPIIIVKGFTNKCCDKFKHNKDLQFTYNESGWIDEETMIMILMNIRAAAGTNKAVLILDSFRTHMTEYVKEHAKAFNIQLVYVPVGKTADHQPLDVGVNGPIKAISRGIIKRIILRDPFQILTLQDSITSLVQAIPKIKKEMIIKAFDDALLLNE